MQQPSFKLNGLDHLRCLAILLVFIFHYGILFPHPSWVNSIDKFGWTGVDLFFVLSGYLISSQLFSSMAKGQSISLRDFFLKRFFRIIPPYLIVLTIYFCFPYVHEREALAPLWKYLTFTQNLGLDLRYHGTFSHAWSLCIEEQFYLVLPATLLLLVRTGLQRRSWILLVGLFLAGFIIRYLVYEYSIAPYLTDDLFKIHWYKKMYYPTYSRLDGLIVGVSIAALFQFRQKLKAVIQERSFLIFVTGLLLLTIAYFICEDEYGLLASVWGFPLIALGYGAILMAAISPNHLLYKWSNGVTRFIATISYALYLSHKMVVHVTHEWLSNWGIAKDSTTAFWVSLSMSILVAWIMHLLIDKPFTTLRKRLVKA